MEQRVRGISSSEVTMVSFTTPTLGIWAGVALAGTFAINVVISAGALIPLIKAVLASAGVATYKAVTTPRTTRSSPRAIFGPKAATKLEELAKAATSHAPLSGPVNPDKAPIRDGANAPQTLAQTMQSLNLNGITTPYTGAPNTFNYSEYFFHLQQPLVVNKKPADGITGGPKR